MTKNTFKKSVIKNKNQSTQTTLLDGEAMNKEYPDTFWIPDEIIRMFAPVGLLVKIATDSNKSFMDERFWVRITKRSYDKSGRVYYTGAIDNRLCFIDANVGDKIEYFEPKHIINIHEKQFFKDIRNGLISINDQDFVTLQEEASEER